MSCSFLLAALGSTAGKSFRREGHWETSFSGLARASGSVLHWLAARSLLELTSNYPVVSRTNASRFPSSFEVCFHARFYPLVSINWLVPQNWLWATPLLSSLVRCLFGCSDPEEAGRDQSELKTQDLWAAGFWELGSNRSPMSCSAPKLRERAPEKAGI